MIWTRKQARTLTVGNTFRFIPTVDGDDISIFTYKVKWMKHELICYYELANPDRPKYIPASSTTDVFIYQLPEQPVE